MPQPVPFTRDQLKAYEAKTEAQTESQVSSAETQTPESQTEPNETETETADSSSVENDAGATETGDDGLEDGDTDSSTVTDADEDSTDSDSETGEGDKPRKGRARERIEDLLAQIKSMREYNTYRDGALEKALAELASLKAASPASKSTETRDVPLDKDDPIPQLKDFNFDPVKTDEARASWLKREAQRLAKAELQNLTAAQEEQKVVEKFGARAEELKKVHADFDTVLNNPTVPKLHQRAARAVVRSDIGPDIAYHLAKNVDKAAKIARMDPEQQLVAIGKIESELEKAQAVAATQSTAAKASDGKTGARNLPKKSVTKAPPPPTTTPAGGTSGIQKDPMKMTMDEFVKWDRQQKIDKRTNNLKLRQAMRGR